MNIRKATMQDLDEMMEIYQRAREFMKENKNEQWGDNYPSCEMIEADMKNMYLCMEGDQIACVFYYAREKDADYEELNIRWLNEEPYAVVHRVASSGIVKGAAQFCLNWAYEQFPNIRMDTYLDNVPMQNLLKKCGFTYCGSFERLGMKDWMAFQK